MSGEILEERSQVAIGNVSDGQLDILGGPVEKPLAELLAPVGEQRLVVLVRHAVDPRLQRLAAATGEPGGQPLAVLGFDHVPAGGLELRRELRDPHPWDNPVEGLAVEVDDPEDVAQPLERRIIDGLPHVALVEFGVAEQRHEP